MAKLAKATVQFEHPAKGPHHCSQCRHFMAPDACETVAGKIFTRDWCEKFSERKSSREDKRKSHYDAL